MKSFIVVMWAIVASASSGSINYKRDIGISSGYGGAFGYATVLSAASVNKYLQSGLVPDVIVPNKKLLRNVPISNGNNEAFVYTSTSVNGNDDQPSNSAVSSGYGGAYGYVPAPNIVNENKEMLPTIAISNAYGGAYGYHLPGSVVNISDYGLKSDSALSKEDGKTYGIFITKNADNVKSDFAISSGYGGAYGYSPASKAIDFKKDSSSFDAISDIHDQAYGFSLPSTIDDDVQMKLSQVMNTQKISVPQMSPSYLPGYSGYGNGISSFSGYSRYPNDANYGFAYANGWL